MIRWIKTGRSVSASGTTITYQAEGAPITIESRKEQIPHANNRPGTWAHTTFVVLVKGMPVKAFHRICDAREYAEGLHA